MHDILKQILEAKGQQLAESKKKVSAAKMREMAAEALPRRDFRTAISRSERVNIIAEVKKASPSLGPIKMDADPAAIARLYSDSGASVLSVLTEETYFKGDRSYLGLVRGVTALPVLRKDFIFDEYQIYESLAYGADAVLLIAAMLDHFQIKDFLAMSAELGMDCLVEVHTAGELERVCAVGAELIGINNRNLNDFSVDVRRADPLIALMPGGKHVVVESGIRTRADIEHFTCLGVNTFLIGETLMRSGDIKRTMNELMFG